MGEYMKLYEKIIIGALTSLTFFAGALKASACTTVIVGSKATKDGSTIIARNEDNSTNWAKHFIVHAHTDTGQTTYVSKGNQFTIRLPKIHQRYTSTPDWTQKHGQYGEDGINESNVAMSATESTDSNRKAIKADPFVKRGISEDAMLDVVLPYIHSARQGVIRMGNIIRKSGAAESDGIIFSDKNEVWYMEIGAGHQWAAVRLPANRYAIIPNQLRIGRLRLKNHKKYLASKHLVSFVRKHKLLGYSKGTVNFAKAFGTSNKADRQENNPRIWDGQRILTPSKKQSPDQRSFQMFMKSDKKITVQKVGQVLASHFTNTKYDSKGRWLNKFRPINMPMNDESHILQIRPHVAKAISGIQWLAMASPDTSVYVPFYTDINNTPVTYQIGTDRYDSKSAFWTYKLTGVLAQPYPNSFTNRYIRPIQRKVNRQLLRHLKNSDKQSSAIAKTADLQTYLTASNQANAVLAQKQFDELNANLITKSTSEVFKELHINVSKG